MNIWVHRYTLTPRRWLGGVAREGAREGALVRVGDGFADVHPWPELGDLALDSQLAMLAKGETTPITRASLHLAALDGEARKKGVSLFEGLIIPESHWPGDDPPAGFDTVKLKSARHLPPDVRIRIDFNAALTPEEFVRIARTLPVERIEFVEDPCPFDRATWRELRVRTGLTLALDTPRGGWNGSDRDAFDVLVHKPALDAEFPRFDGEVVVTSYMDHPVGQFGAAFVAATNRVSRRCGLFTHVLYQEDAFVERVRSDGARLLPPEGTGIGFDDMLAGLPWKRLC